MLDRTVIERHPPSIRARIARSARFLRKIRGWQRLVNGLLPADVRGEFVVDNDGTVFSGDLGSYIDRHTYLFGQYEREPIQLFLEHASATRRGTLLDVGANAGTHSMAFAQHFAEVYSFEPNPALWAQFERNVELNRFANVHLQRVGLADVAADLPFHATSIANYGLGTFAISEQYSVPLQRIGDCRVERGDEYLESIGIESIDALKIDVQGFEPQVLRGLRGMLARSRPIVWFELGAGTEGMADWGALALLFPYPVRALRLVPVTNLLVRSLQLMETRDELAEGDYFVLPV